MMRIMWSWFMHFTSMVTVWILLNATHIPLLCIMPSIQVIKAWVCNFEETGTVLKKWACCGLYASQKTLKPFKLLFFRNPHRWCERLPCHCSSVIMLFQVLTFRTPSFNRMEPHHILYVSEYFSICFWNSYHNSIIVFHCMCVCTHECSWAHGCVSRAFSKVNQNMSITTKAISTVTIL